MYVHASHTHTFTLDFVHKFKPFTTAAVKATNCVGTVVVTVVTAIVALINICGWEKNAIQCTLYR